MDSYTPSRRQRNARVSPIYQFSGRDHPPGRDSHRPKEFSFRAQYQNGRPAPSFPQRSQPPPERPQNQTRQNGIQAKSHLRGGPPPDRKNFRHNQQTRQPTATSDRPLLRGRRAPTPEQLLGMNKGDARFKSLQDLSDSEEEDMDLESGSEAPPEASRDITDEPPRKKRHVQTNDDAASAVPKWSNPDPYTSLPPPDETQGKRKDVVKLIRKAKASTETSKTSVADGDDFISFSAENEDSHEKVMDNTHGAMMRVRGVPGAPTGPKFSHLENLHPNRSAPGVSTATISIDDLGPPPPPPKELKDVFDMEKIDVWPPPNPPQHMAPKIVRKRDHSEVSDESKSGKRGGKNRKTHGSLRLEWEPKTSQNSMPWLTSDHSNCESMGLWLHKEICDFYNFVKPQPFENEMRHALVRRVSRFVDDNYRDAEIAFFGSFAAGTYLPDADMDLVVLSRSFQQRGIAVLGQRKKELFNFAKRLESAGIAKPGSTCTIWGAKVPIVKYVDNYTGLRCDISFENSTGPVANKTYSDWKAAFPAMPILVCMVKQFLLMRGMNEVHTGGLGSFAVNCLVVSLMQHLPQVATGSMDPTRNLGELFMHFLDFYGNKFNQTTTGIQLSPPAYFPKHLERRVKYDPKKMWKLSILDPNRPENDISSGTVNIVAILDMFSWAYGTLKARMNELQSRQNSGRGRTGAGHEDDNSILSPVYAGDYSSFVRQRERMQRLYAER